MPEITPVTLPPDALLALHAAHPKRYPVLLQSAARGGSLGRHDILLAFPKDRLDWNPDPSHPSRRRATFLDAFDSLWTAERCPPTNSYLPFIGGWFLFLGYELNGEIEPSLAVSSADPGSSPRAIALRIPAAIVVRHADGKAWIVDEDAKLAMTRDIERELATLSEPPVHRHRVLVRDLEEEPADLYRESVGRALERISAGDIYQANLSRIWRGTIAEGVRPHDIYVRLRAANPSPFAALMSLDEFAIVSSSPERLIEVRAGIASTRPIAGTRPRGVDQDEKMRNELKSHPKERAEHIMLIDLERNDLGRICEAGTVEVDEFMSLESYAHVHHIVSNVRGRLRDNLTPGHVIAAVFPGGTITGCPKVSCMQIIRELEGAPRGAYTGSLGYVNRDGSMDLNILIRSIVLRGRQLEFRAGAGIVADSIPERELEETRAKARGMIQALA